MPVASQRRASTGGGRGRGGRGRGGRGGGRGGRGAATVDSVDAPPPAKKARKKRGARAVEESEAAPATETLRHRTNSLRALRAAQSTQESRQLLLSGTTGESAAGGVEESWGDNGVDVEVGVVASSHPGRKKGRSRKPHVGVSSSLTELSEDKKRVSILSPPLPPAVLHLF